MMAAILVCLAACAGWVLGSSFTAAGMADDLVTLEGERLALESERRAFRRERDDHENRRVPREHFERVVRSVLDANPPSRRLEYVGRGARKGWLH
jgi:hypothetical protein